MRAAWQELSEQELEDQFNPRVVFLGASVVQGIMEDWRQSRPLGNGYSGTLFQCRTAHRTSSVSPSR
eukprot:scaffold85_cov51-Attheya_sp.AAC.2